MPEVSVVCRGHLVRPARPRSTIAAELWLVDALASLPPGHPGMARLAAWAGLGRCGDAWAVAEAACARGRASEAPRRRTRGPEW